MENFFQKTEESHNDSEECPIAMSRIMKEIFSSCDPENCGFVLVSHLVDFITPFLQGNKDALQELRVALDPVGTNPLIDSGKFYNAMNEWANKISHEGNDVNDFHNVTPRDLERLESSDFPFAHSTPRSSFGHHLLKGYVESGILNASNTSTYSYTPNNATGCTDKVFYEDQINELEHKNKKLNEELIHVRQELAICIDQNETLQSDVDRLSKRLVNQEKAYEQMMKEKKCEEDCQEALNQAQKQIIKMKNNLAVCKKLYNTSKEQMDDLKAENINLQSKIIHLTKMSDEFKATFNALQETIDLKESEIASLQDLNASLQDKIKENIETLEQYNAKIDTLKAEKKLLSDRIIKSDSFPIPNKPTPPKSSTPNEYEPANNLAQNSPNSSLLDSSEDDICSIHRSLTPPSHYVSLQAEIAQATRNNIDHECDLNIKLVESENKILSLQFEHQNCEAIIEKYRQEIEDLKRQIREGKEVLKQFSTNVSELKSEISLGEDREVVLHGRCCELSEKLNKSKSFVTEVKLKMEEHCDLQTKYEEFRAKVESLETENSIKYIKIVELTMENQNHLDKMSDLQVEINKLEEDNQNFKEKEQKHEEKLQEIIEKHAVKLQKYEEENLEKKYRLLEANYFDAQEIIASLKQDCYTLEQEKELLNAINAELKTRNSELEIKKEELKRALENVKSEFERFNTENERAKGELLKEKEELKTKLEKNDFNMKKQDIESKKLSVELVALKLARDKTAENLENQQKTISVLQSERFDLQQTILQGIKERKELQKINKDFEVQLKENASKLTLKEALVENLEKEIEFHQSEINNVKSRRSELQKKCDELVERLEEAEATRKKLQLEINLAEQIRQDFNNNLNELQVIQHRENSLKNEIAELNESNWKLILEVHNVRKLNAKMNEDLSSSTDEKAKLSKQIEDLLFDRENKIRLIEAANEKLISTQSQMRSFEEKLLKSDSTIEVDYVDEIEKLKNENGINKSELRKLNDEKSELENKLICIMTDKKEADGKLEELMLEKEKWLTEKVMGESCNSCRTLEAKLGRRTGFDKVAIKAHKLEQKVEELENQLLREKTQNIDAVKKVTDEKEELELENKTLYGEKLGARRKLIGALKATAKLEREKQSLTEEIQLLKSKLTKVENANAFATESDAAVKLEDFKTVCEVLREARLNLSKSTLDMANSWNLFFGGNIGLDEFWTMFGEGSSSCSDEIARLKHQIDATTILLASFIAMKSSEANQSDEALLNVQEADSQVITQSSKLLKKFTLKPATLIVRPVSPDSPSMDGLCQKFSAIGDCPDSMGDNLPSPSVISDLEQFKPKPDVKGDFVSNLAIPEQEASPNLNTDVLEDLGLLSDNIRFSEKETEEKFTAIVLAFTVDNASLLERMEKQKDILIIKEGALAAKLGDLLDVMKDYLTEEQYASVSLLIEAILGVCAQVSISAGQYGALRYEHRLVKTVAIMINYAAILSRRLDSNHNQSPHTVPLQSSRSPKSNKKSSSCKSIFNRVGNPVTLKEDLRTDNRNTTSDSRKKAENLKKLGPLLALILTVSFMYFTIFASNAGCSNPVQSQRSYPWSWLSWDELFDYFVTKEYRDGPPPT